MFRGGIEFLKTARRIAGRSRTMLVVTGAWRTVQEEQSRNLFPEISPGHPRISTGQGALDQLLFLRGQRQGQGVLMRRRGHLLPCLLDGVDHLVFGVRAARSAN